MIGLFGIRGFSIPSGNVKVKQVSIDMSQIAFEAA